MAAQDALSQLGQALTGGVIGFLTALTGMRMRIYGIERDYKEIKATVEGKFSEVGRQCQSNKKLAIACLDILAGVAKKLDLDKREYSDLLIRAINDED